MEVIVFIGAPASGKSTFYRQRFAETHTLVSKDLLRNNARPARRQRVLLEEALQRRESVVVDNTSPTREDRAAVIEVAREHGVPVDGYVFHSVAAECVERNKLRSGKARVPPVAIYSFFKRYQAPGVGEGFRALYRVQLDGTGGFRVEEAHEAQ